MSKCECNATRFIFNLNNHIRFKPKELGKVIYKAHWMPYCINREPREIEIDDDGWADMQLWEFMSVYGGHFHNGMNVPIETTVMLVNSTAEEQQMIEQYLQKNERKETL